MRVLIVGIKGFLGRYTLRVDDCKRVHVHGLDISAFPAVTDRKLASTSLGNFSAEETLSQAPELETFEAMVQLAARGRCVGSERAMAHGTADVHRFPGVCAQWALKGTYFLLLRARCMATVNECFPNRSRILPRFPETAYRRFMAAYERLLATHFRGRPRQVTIFRPFNLIGPRQSPMFFAPNLIRLQVVVREAFKAPVLERGNTTAFRDFVGELLGTTPLNPSRGRPKNGDMQRLLSHKIQVRALLNWPPHISLKERLCSTIAWFESHMHLCHRALEEYVV